MEQIHQVFLKVDSVIRRNVVIHRIGNAMVKKSAGQIDGILGCHSIYPATS